MADVSLLIKVAFVLLGVGFLFHLIGFAAPYWHVHEWVRTNQRMRDRNDWDYAKINYGLWRWCQESHRSNYNYRMEWCGSMVSGTYGTDYIRATQFFETVGFLTALVSLVLLLLGACIVTCRERRILPILSAICAFGAAGCIILGCIIFGAKDQEKDHLSWAFALALVGGIFFGVAGVVILVATVAIKR